MGCSFPKILTHQTSRSKLPDVGAEEVQPSRYAVDPPRVIGSRPPRFLPSLEGLVLSPGAWGAPFKGNVSVSLGIFYAAGRFWATALRPDPP